jgi:hypothetical protein
MVTYENMITSVIPLIKYESSPLASLVVTYEDMIISVIPPIKYESE